MKKYKLFRVAEKLSPHGYYFLKPFDDGRFNKEFDYANGNIELLDALDDRIADLAQSIFDNGMFYYVDPADFHADSLYVFDQCGNIVFFNNGDVVATIPNTIPKIATDSAESIFIVAFDADYTRHCWVVVSPV